MRVTSKGQVTIPLAMREKAGLLPNTEVVVELDGEGVHIRPSRQDLERGGGIRLVEHMRGRGDGPMTTDEIMALTRRGE
jgi:AbrB family looped-hinge helix DNA binding protein